MSCSNNNKQNEDKTLQVPTCNRRVSICGTINLPQGFRLGGGTLQFATNACLQCRTEDIEIECTTGIVDQCAPVSGLIKAKAIRAAGALNYIISVSVISTCPDSSAFVKLENSICVDQVVCIGDADFECDPAIAECDAHFIFIGIRQVTPEGCDGPTRLDVRAILELFEQVCPGIETKETIPREVLGQFDQIYIKE